MSRRFSLAGLLRVRRIQEDLAQGALAERTATLRESEAVRERALRHLAGFGEPGLSLETLRAIAVARAAGAAMLAELQTHRSGLESDVAEARAAHREARIRTRGIERLEAAHTARIDAEALRAEQLRLDELGSARAANREEH